MTKLTIQYNNLDEQSLIELYLNRISQGCSTLDEALLVMGFFSLNEGWHVDKFIYYYNLLKEVKQDDN